MDWFGPLPMRALTDSEKHNKRTPQEESRTHPVGTRPHTEQ